MRSYIIVRSHRVNRASLLAIACVILLCFIAMTCLNSLNHIISMDVRDEKDVKFVLLADRQQEGYEDKLLTFRNGSSITKNDNLEVIKSAQIHSISKNATNGLLAETSMPLYEKNGTVQLQTSPSLPSENGKENEIVFTHYLGHIPKSGTSYAFLALSKLLYTSPEYSHGSFRLCNEGFNNPTKWKTMRYEIEHTRCTLWMSEPGMYSGIPQHSYVIIREPIGHTVSMYFHCAESKSHERARHKMPSTIDEWIEAWRDAKDNATKVKENERFSCYNPIEFQSKTIAYNPALGKSDLRKKWDIIGDNSQMHKSVCMIFVKYAGWVPKDCDGTGVVQPNKKRPRRLDALAYDPNKHAHGVNHHGATYVLTPEQKEIISSFRKQDLELYNLVVDEIFEEQVQQIEREYNFTLCDAIPSAAAN